MELKILTGNNLAVSSQKAAEDDMYGEILEKWATKSKRSKDDQVLTKDNAKEACSELYEKKNNVDSYDAQD